MASQQQILMPWGSSPHSELECREMLFPFLGLFESAHMNAIGKWEAVDPETRDDVSSMQRGGVLHDLIKEEVARLVEEEGCSELEVCRSEFFKLYVNGEVVVRFKKLTGLHTVPFDNQTHNTKRYYCGYPLSSVRSHCTRLTCGYVLDEEGGLVDIAVSSQMAEILLWSYSLLESISSEGGAESHGVEPDEAEIIIDDDQDNDAEVA